jgi:hypothetical protein
MRHETNLKKWRVTLLTTFCNLSVSGQSYTILAHPRQVSFL